METRKTPRRVAEGARERVKACAEQQRTTLRAVRAGRPLAAEPDVERSVERAVARALHAPGGVRARTVLGRPPVGSNGADGHVSGGPERIQGPTADFVGVAFLERGMRAARCVGRVVERDGSPVGTGFLVAPGLFLSNQHVLEDPARARELVLELDYEEDPDGVPRPTSRFVFAPGELWVADERDDLDFALVAVGERFAGSGTLAAYGYAALSGAGDKHVLGEVANVVQHPGGRPKEVVLRENRLVSRLSHVLHYVSDTEPGSSGAPVFNNEWQAIALHHWGGPWRQDRDADGLPVPRTVNEGIRVSAIVEELAAPPAHLGAAQRRRLAEALRLGESTAGLPVAPPPAATAGHAPGERRVEVRPDGTAVWQLPLEITVAVPGFASGAPALAHAAADEAPVAAPSAPAAPESFRRTVDADYDNRRGYRERFLVRRWVRLPDLSAHTCRLARNQQAEAGDDPFELAYQHFSVFVDRTRGLPLLTACNIDGEELRSIDRSTGAVSRAESLRDASEAGGAEARERWFVDPRLSAGDCHDDSLYIDQVLAPGPNRIGRMFHRGHLVRRLDPCWGSDARALRAEADTFHFTNCAPQIGRFNAGHSLWLGLEDHVLDNARVEDRRVSVFCGPVLADDDPAYREDRFAGFRVPRRFWKLVFWIVDDERLAALALLADQGPLLAELPERLEALDDTAEIEEFVTSVAHLESVTGIDFGERVREADLHADAGPENGPENGSENGSPNGPERARGGPRRVRSFADLRLAHPASTVADERR